MMKHIVAMTSPKEMPITSTVMTTHPYPATTFTEEAISYEFIFFFKFNFYHIYFEWGNICMW